MIASTLPSVPITPETARELTRAAKRLDAARDHRDQLVVQAVREGAGLREVARAVGLTHPAITKILRRAES